MILFVFILSLLIGSIGLTLIIRFFRVRKNCLPVTGRMLSFITKWENSDVNGKTRMYQAVIKFEGLDGENYIFISPFSSSTKPGNVGYPVELLVNRLDPYKVYLKNSPDELFISIATVAMSLLMGSLSYHSVSKDTLLIAIICTLTIALFLNFANPVLSSSLKNRSPQRLKSGLQLSSPEVYLDREAPHEKWAEYLLTEDF